MESSKNKLLGLFLITIGAVLVMDYYHIIHFSIWGLWPLILIYIGAKAERDYFQGLTSARSLLSGATLLTYGLYFLASSFLSWGIQDKLWPLYIMGPAIGFLQMAYFNYRPKSNFRTGILMFGFSVVMLVQNFINIKFDLILYVGLIAIGLFMLRSTTEQPYDYDTPESETKTKITNKNDKERY